MKRMHLPRRLSGIAAGILAALTFAPAAYAQTQFHTPVLNVPLDNPRIFFDGSTSSQIVYDPNSTLLKLDAVATYVELVSGGGAIFFTPESSSFVKTFHLRGRVDHTGHHVRGIEPGDPDDVCGAGHDFCVTGTWGPFTSNPADPDSALLYGEVVGIGAANNLDIDPTYGLPRDHFEFQIRITGGAVQSFGSPGYPSGWNSLVVIVQSIPLAGSAEFNGDFRQGFAGVVDGASGPTDDVAFLSAWDNCNGRIGGRVQNALSLAAFSDVAITVSGGYLSAPEKANTDANGAYSIGNLCAGTYQVEASTPQWYVSPGPTVTAVTLTTDSASNDNSNTGVNFSFYQTGAVNSAYTTFTQAGWGSKPRGNNPGKTLADWFNILYPDPDGGVVIGLPGPLYSVTLTSANVVQDFLPQGGREAVLQHDYVDPAGWLKLKHHRKLWIHKSLGELAGNVLALQLNVDFSNASLTRAGLGGLHLAKGKLTGQTVNQVLALGNQVLGGAVGVLPVGVTVHDLDESIESINRNFEAGTRDGRYLQ